MSLTTVKEPFTFLLAPLSKAAFENTILDRSPLRGALLVPLPWS